VHAMLGGWGSQRGGFAFGFALNANRRKCWINRDILDGGEGRDCSIPTCFRGNIARFSEESSGIRPNQA
jgi:hypothetical protein